MTHAIAYDKIVGAAGMSAICLVSGFMPLRPQSAECVTYRFVHLWPIGQAQALTVCFPGPGTHALSFS